MILTVTLNPLLEHRLIYTKINHGRVNRNPYEEYKAGGKGINVSRQLNYLNVPNLSFFFLGGNAGRIYKNALEKEGIKFSALRTSSETRTAVLIKDESDRAVTSYFGLDPSVSAEEAGEFKLKLEKMIANCEIVIFSGSSPCSETNSIIPFGIRTANKYDKVSFCDTYGSSLQECIECSPTIMHNNSEEIENSLRLSLQNENDKLKFLEYLYGKGVKQAYITNGEKETYASNFDFHFKVENPKIDPADPTGSGDSFAAGIIYGWYNDLTFTETLELASSLGTLNAGSFEICSVSLEEALKFKDKIKISSLGKKIKSIDTSPV
ncbi:MAG TPA: PfkB family carbohydrate kinase [Ignavibacteriaceae bacterium]|nr:PfkB family carbohydrate kinase [Ignavibacteriaceae bacterium]